MIFSATVGDAHMFLSLSPPTWREAGRGPLWAAAVWQGDSRPVFDSPGVDL